jgi:hypothetical protein
VTEPAPVSNHPTTDSWEGILDALRRRYPGQRDSVLFCIYKLQQNPSLTLRDFGAEAKLHGIATAGRALHSARQLLGLVKESREAPRAASVTTSELLADDSRQTRRLRAPAVDDGTSIESKVLSAVRQIQSAAGAETEQLKVAIRQAIAILQRALGS